MAPQGAHPYRIAHSEWNTRLPPTEETRPRPIPRQKVPMRSSGSLPPHRWNAIDTALPIPSARGFWKTELACKLFKISMVRKGGLEPPWIAPPDPKSGASANSATFAPSCSLDHSHFKFCLCVSAQHGFVAARNHSPAWIPQGAEGKIPCRCLHSTHSSNLHLNCRMNLEGGGTIRDAQGRPVGRAKPFRRSLPHADA